MGSSLSKDSRSATSCEERECFDRWCPSNHTYGDLFRLMNNVRRVLRDALGCFVDVPGDLMSVLGIFVCALLKGGLSGCQ